MIINKEHLGGATGNILSFREGTPPLSWKTGVIVLNRLVQFDVIRRYVKTDSVYTTHRLNALAAPPGIRI